MGFFVVVEINSTGYIIGRYSTLKEALIEFETIWKIADNFFYHEGEDARKTFFYFKKYIIRNELYINLQGSYIITDGIISTYILEEEKNWENIESFIKERGFQIKCILIYNI